MVKVQKTNENKKVPSPDQLKYLFPIKDFTEVYFSTKYKWK